jgi:hypothetical protein
MHLQPLDISSLSTILMIVSALMIVELRRIGERLEREDLQERLAQALQAQQNLEQERQRQQ